MPVTCKTMSHGLKNATHVTLVEFQSQEVA